MDWWVAVWGPIVVAVVLWVLKEVVALRRDLVKHMGNEETLRAGDLAQREERQRATDQSMEAVIAELHEQRAEMRDGFRQVHARIDQALTHS